MGQRRPRNGRASCSGCFWDEQNGGFFTSGSDAEPLIARMKDVYDGAVPSANATAVLALARLGELTGGTSFHRRCSPDRRLHGTCHVT